MFRYSLLELKLTYLRDSVRIHADAESLSVGYCIQPEND